MRAACILLAAWACAALLRDQCVAASDATKHVTELTVEGDAASLHTDEREASDPMHACDGSKQGGSTAANHNDAPLLGVLLEELAVTEALVAEYQRRLTLLQQARDRILAGERCGTASRATDGRCSG